MPSELAVMDDAIRLHPDDYRLYVQRAEMLQHMGRPDAALADRERATQLNALDPGLWTDLAALRYTLGDYLGALRDYDKPVALRPKQAVYYRNRAVAAAACGQVERAAVDLESALALEPGDPDVLYLRGSLRRQLGQPVAALADLDAVLAARPEDSLAWEERAETCAALGRRADAAAAWERSLAFDPTADRYYRCAVWYAGGEQLAEALALLDRALALVASHSDALGERARLRLAVGNDAGALQDYRQIVDLAPEDPCAWTRCAEIYVRQAAWVEAATAAAHAITLAPGTAEAYKYHAQAARALNQLGPARADLRKYLELGPDAAGRAWAERELSALDAGEKRPGLLSRLMGR